MKNMVEVGVDLSRAVIPFITEIEQFMSPLDSDFHITFWSWYVKC